MLSFKLLGGLLAGLLSTPVWASAPATLVTTTPEQYFERAQSKSEQIRSTFERWVTLEKSGALDTKVESERLDNVKKLKASMISDLEKASDGGLALAIYWLSSINAEFFMEEPKRTHHCQTLQKAVDQGLLAASVAYFHQCDQPYMRFDFQNPVHLKAMARLKQLLLESDPFKDAYPLLAVRSLCFQDVRAEIAEKKNLANMYAHAQTMLLTYDQYRADGYYILAATHMNEKGQPDSQNLAYLNQALALGCNDVMSFKDFYEKSFGSSAR